MIPSENVLCRLKAVWEHTSHTPVTSQVFSFHNRTHHSFTTALTTQPYSPHSFTTALTTQPHSPHSITTALTTQLHNRTHHTASQPYSPHNRTHAHTTTRLYAHIRAHTLCIHTLRDGYIPST